MKIYHFNRLRPHQRRRLTEDSGKYLSTIRDIYFGIHLYALHNFYVELWFNKKDNKVFKVKSFLDTNNLDPYLKRIKLSEINELY